MKYYIHQRFLSWFDSFDIYDENNHPVYKVEGRLSWGHCLHFLDQYGNHIAAVQEKIITFLPQFEFYIHGEYQGKLQRQLSLFIPRYQIDFNGWQISGDLMQWNYQINDANGKEIACIQKDILHFTDHYVVDIDKQENALCVLMLVIAIDAEKCTASKRA